MKVVLELNGNPKEDDLILFIDGEWKIISKNKFLDGVNYSLKLVNERIDELATKTTTSFENVNSKLKDYHDVLKLIVEEER